MIEANLNDKTYCQMDKESVLVQNYNGKTTDSDYGLDGHDHGQRSEFLITNSDI